MSVNIHGKTYITVAERLAKAHKDSKIQGVKTEVLQFNPYIVVKATVNVAGIEYTGISAVDTSKQLNNFAPEKTNPYEVAETSAVGRALAFAGYEIEGGIASADEIQKYQDPTLEDPDWVKGDSTPKQPLPEDKKVCMAHETPVQMFKGQSKTKVDDKGNPKTYWWHSDPQKGMCFGDGFKN